MMKPTRSLLFVPGHKPAWMEKAVKYGADVLILDLEDSVPDNEKVAARPLVKAALKSLSAQGQVCNVRVNGFVTGLTFDDLDGSHLSGAQRGRPAESGNSGRDEGPGYYADPFGKTAQSRHWDDQDFPGHRDGQGPAKLPMILSLPVRE